jgi:hypothetical protein
MRRTTLPSVAACLAISAAAAGAQSSAAHDHIVQVADAFEGTPAGLGLLSTAIAEAVIARQHVELANAAAPSIADVQLHVGHMLHALDPTSMVGGPGLGYGVRLAAGSAADHIAMAASDPGASENARAHLEHIAVILANVTRRMDEMIALAHQIQGASTATTPALLERLSLQAETLLVGRDVDGDDRIGWRAGEGGLRQAAQHMTLLKRGEGLLP